MATLTREGQEVLVSAVLTFESGKATVGDPAIKIAVDHMLHIGAENISESCSLYMSVCVCG
jgi:hypothetical protein